MTNEWIAIGVAVAVFVAVLLFLWTRAKRTRNVGRPVTGGPSNLRFTCAGCSRQFTHSRRTLSEWVEGLRQFHCKACHTRRRGTRPVQRSPRSGP
ncbi:MAG TPA: hypothetical protein VGP22_12715 [Albitalea sp.]|jgi:DNA-directed RNA polymerase subunit RPC12/RpoP|nr:hypothetical protein [Albitalea sp.]